MSEYSKHKKKQKTFAKKIDITKMPVEFFDAVLIYAIKDSISTLNHLLIDDKKRYIEEGKEYLLENIKGYEAHLDHLHKTLDYFGGSTG